MAKVKLDLLKRGLPMLETPQRERETCKCLLAASSNGEDEAKACKTRLTMMMMRSRKW